MYYQVIAQCTQSLKNLETCLDKADRYAANKKFDAGVLMSSRLARAFWSAESPPSCHPDDPVDVRVGSKAENLALSI